MEIVHAVHETANAFQNITTSWTAPFQNIVLPFPRSAAFSAECHTFREILHFVYEHYYLDLLHLKLGFLTMHSSFTSMLLLSMYTASCNRHLHLSAEGLFNKSKTTIQALHLWHAKIAWNHKNKHGIGSCLLFVWLCISQTGNKLQRSCRYSQI